MKWPVQTVSASDVEGASLKVGGTLQGTETGDKWIQTDKWSVFMLLVWCIHRVDTKRDVWHFVKVKLHQHRETGEHIVSVVEGDRRNSAAEGSTVR